MKHIKKFTVIIFCMNGRVLKYHNVIERNLFESVNKLAAPHNGMQYANLYDPITKNFVRRISNSDVQTG